MTRLARCAYCQTTKPSNPNLPFFEERGPGSRYATQRCNNCGYNVVAHTPETQSRNTNKGKSLICSSFTPTNEGHEFDLYYCGCRGWD